MLLNRKKMCLMDVVEVGVFVKGNITGGSIKLFVEFTNKEYADDIKKIIDHLDHTSITDSKTIYENCARSFLIEYNDTILDIYDTYNIIGNVALKLLRVEANIPVKCVTVTHIDDKYSLTLNKLSQNIKILQGKINNVELKGEL